MQMEGDYHKLEEIEVTMTPLASCDFSRCSAPRLSVLNMTYNQLKTLDFPINLQNLQYASLRIIFIDVDHNLLAEVRIGSMCQKKAVFNEMPKMRDLSLRKCYL
jgi:hypothetical protein